MAHLVHVGNFIIWFSKHVINKKKTNRSSLFFPKSINDSILKGGGGSQLSSLKSRFISQSGVFYSPWYRFRTFHPNDRVGEGAGLSRWLTGAGFGHSQEVVGSASGHVGLAAAGGRIELKAGRGRKITHELLQTDKLVRKTLKPTTC